jgi:hypothetical protein
MSSCYIPDIYSLEVPKWKNNFDSYTILKDILQTQDQNCRVANKIAKVYSKL